MIKKYITPILLVFLAMTIICNIILAIKYKSTDDIIAKSSVESQFYMNLNYKLLEDVGIQYLNEDIELKEDINLQNEKGEKINLVDLTKNKVFLVLRYSELNCQACVDVQIKELNDFAKEIGKDHILLIASYKNKRDLVSFKRINQIEFPIYNIEESGLGLELEKLSSPFYFILDQKNISSLVFVPTKEFGQLTKSYFSVVKNRFFY